MAIQIGDTLPSVSISTMGSSAPESIHTDDIFKDKKVVLFAVPGAFTPGCSMTHLPGYVVHGDAIKAKGVDTVACISVNDAFVMDAWGKAQNAEYILMLADGNADFTKAIGLELDCSGYGMGIRSKRYAMIVDNGMVKTLEIDAKGVDKSSAENILSLV